MLLRAASDYFARIGTSFVLTKKVRHLVKHYKGIDVFL